MMTYFRSIALLVLFTNINPFNANSIIKSNSNAIRNKPFLWKIQGNTSSYLFGTIHVPFVEVWNPMKDDIMTTFNISQKLYLEIDMELQQNKQDFSKCILIPNGKTDGLPTIVRTRLSEYIDFLKNKIGVWLTQEQKHKGITPEKVFQTVFRNWKRKRLIWTMNSILDVTESYVRFFGYESLDDHLHSLAKEQNKEIGQVETALEACSIFNEVDPSHLLHFIEKLLELKNDAILDIASSWKNDVLLEYKGANLSASTLFKDSRHFTQYLEDNRKIESDEIVFGRHSKIVNNHHQEAEELTTYFRTKLLLDRNRKMSEKINQMLHNEPNTSFFFAFGASHFVGKDGIVEILKRQGYKITRQPETNSVPQIQDPIRDPTEIPKGHGERTQKSFSQTLVSYSTQTVHNEQSRSSAGFGILLQSLCMVLFVQVVFDLIQFNYVFTKI